MSKKKQPNQLAQAIQELSSLNLGDFVIPKEIHEVEAKHHYVCIGIKTRDSLDGLSKEVTARVVYSSVNKWQDMEAEVRSGRVKTMFGGAFQKVVVLNNPTLPMVENEETKELKPLANTHKGKVNKFVEEFGKPDNEEDLAELVKLVGVEEARVKAYLEII